MIIQSLLDTDLYKFTMQQLVFHRFPTVTAEYQFILRTPNVDLTPLSHAIYREINHLCQLRFTADELAYLQKLPYIQADFVELLRNFQLNPNHVSIDDTLPFALNVRGPWLQTILFEIPLLAIISELYCQQQKNDSGQQRLQAKIAFIQQHANPKFKFSDFGSRRRFSSTWQKHLLIQLRDQLPQHFIGTSNVFYAKQLGLMPIGTMAHEYIQAFQALTPDITHSQKIAFTTWLDEYPNQLGIALSDTLDINQFLKDFDDDLANQYTGARHDSGDPFQWGERLLKHYHKLHIDPQQKTLVFSDGLSVEKAMRIHQHFCDRTNPVFGIGTNLTNDVGLHPLDMVIKMVRCNNLPVAKISDDPGKTVCVDPQYLVRLKRLLVDYTRDP